MQITTVGLDLAKYWFQVHGVDAAGRPSSSDGFAGRRSSSFSKAWSPASSAWKPAPRRIIGRAN